MRYFDITCVISFIVGNELTAAFVWDWKMRSYVRQTATCIMLIFIMKVEAAFYSLYFQSFLNPFLSHKVLLQSSKSSWMLSVLSDLDQRVPFMGSELLLTIVTLSILFNELNYLRLLYFRGLVYLSYKLYFYANSLAMGFSPHKFGFFDFHFSQPLYFLQKNGQKLSTFSLTVYPRWPLVSFTIYAQKLLFWSRK